jgi:hypothetical protein
MRRIKQWIASAMRDQYTEPEAHFHQGPETTPAVCYDERCRIPRLDVGAQ